VRAQLTAERAESKRRLEEAQRRQVDQEARLREATAARQAGAAEVAKLRQRLLDLEQMIEGLRLALLARDKVIEDLSRPLFVRSARWLWRALKKDNDAKGLARR
jgi:hypothetical protein